METLAERYENRITEKKNQKVLDAKFRERKNRMRLTTNRPVYYYAPVAQPKELCISAAEARWEAESEAWGFETRYAVDGFDPRQVAALNKTALGRDAL
ncbi:hypothetical protein, partial [Rhodoglobus sp.]